MQLSEFAFTTENHFVALENYGLVFNRTYLILLAEEAMIGLVARGYLGVPVESDPLSSIISGLWAADGDFDDKNSYLDHRRLARYSGVDLLTGDLARLDRANFRTSYAAVTDVAHDPRRKWSMGSYPHDGRIYLRLDGRRREFIPLGRQFGGLIVKRIEAKRSRR